MKVFMYVVICVWFKSTNIYMYQSKKKNKTGEILFSSKPRINIIPYLIWYKIIALVHNKITVNLYTVRFSAFTYGRAKSSQGFLKQELSCHLRAVVLKHLENLQRKRPRVFKLHCVIILTARSDTMEKTIYNLYEL